MEIRVWKQNGFEALKSRLFQKSISFCFGVRKNDRFQNLPIFSPVEAFLPKTKFLNFFGYRAEKLCIFAPLFENSKISENDWRREKRIGKRGIWCQ